MRIEDLKRWHWVIVGVAIGLLISYWRGSIDAEMALRGHDSLDVASFERYLARTSRDGRPLLRNIRVYPADGGVFWVTAEELPGRGGRGRGWGLFGRRRGGDQQPDVAPDTQYNPVMVRTVTPFVPTINPPTNSDPNYTVVDYLTEIKSKNPGVDFSSRWWDREPLRTTIWTLAGALVIGGIWPSLINLLIGAGYGHRSEKKDSDYDLSRFGKGQATPATATKSEPTEAELARLRQLEEELGRNLAGAGLGVETSTDTAPGNTSAPTEQPLRVLTGGPVEAVAPEQPKDDKQYSGEFYPTVTHVKK